VSDSFNFVSSGKPTVVLYCFIIKHKKPFTILNILILLYFIYGMIFAEF